MADANPPDFDGKAGKHGGTTSGKVADFRYKPPAQPRAIREPSGAGETAPGAHSDYTGFDPPKRRQAFAALDLGTNNCRLLIARPSGEHFTVIDAFSRVVRLGEGLAASGRLSDEAMDRALGALHVCAEKLKRRNVHLARSVATEACRRAANGADFIARVREETGIALDIISAQEEARLAVLGCHILLEDGEGPAVVFDIGGGSTELVLIEPGGAGAAHPRLALGALGRGFADRQRTPARRHSGGPRQALREDAATCLYCLRALRQKGGAGGRRGEARAPDGHQRHGDDARQRPPRAAAL